jgi:hypothetical protein
MKLAENLTVALFATLLSFFTISAALGVDPSQPSPKVQAR